MKNKWKKTGITAGIITVGTIIVKSISGLLCRGKKYDDLGCDWYCDCCDTYLNDQPGFRAGSVWPCSKCGCMNDVSVNNIVYPYEIDVYDIDDVEVSKYWEDPEDY